MDFTLLDYFVVVEGLVAEDAPIIVGFVDFAKLDWNGAIVEDFEHQEGGIA